MTEPIGQHLRMHGPMTQGSGTQKRAANTGGSSVEFTESIALMQNSLIFNLRWSSMVNDPSSNNRKFVVLLLTNPPGHSVELYSTNENTSSAVICWSVTLEYTGNNSSDLFVVDGLQISNPMLYMGISSRQQGIKGIFPENDVSPSSFNNSVKSVIQFTKINK